MRKRSKYRPKPIRLDTVAYVASGFKKVGTLPEAGVNLKLKNHEALDSILRGQGNRDQCDVLIAAFNVAEALWRLNADLGEAHAPDIKAGQDAILSMAKRYIRTGSMAFTGPEMAEVKYTMQIHDAQLDACTVREMEHAIDFVTKELMANRARTIVETV